MFCRAFSEHLTYLSLFLAINPVRAMVEHGAEHSTPSVFREYATPSSGQEGRAVGRGELGVEQSGLRVHCLNAA